MARKSERLVPVRVSEPSSESIDRENYFVRPTNSERDPLHAITMHLHDPSTIPTNPLNGELRHLDA